MWRLQRGCRGEAGDRGGAGQCDFTLTRLRPKVGTFLGNVLMDTDSQRAGLRGYRRKLLDWRPNEETTCGGPVIESEGNMFWGLFLEIIWRSDSEPNVVGNMEKSKEKEFSWKYLLFFFSWAEKILNLPVFLISWHPAHHMVMVSLQLPKGCDTAEGVTVQGLQDPSCPPPFRWDSGEIRPSVRSLPLCLDHHRTS